MPSEFVEHFTRSLEPSTSRLDSPSPSPIPWSHSQVLNSNEPLSSRKQALHALLVSVNQNGASIADIRRRLLTLQTLIDSRNFVDSQGLEYSGGMAADAEEDALEKAIVGRLTVSLYANALETLITQATHVEAEAEWWSDVQSSYFRVSMYFLETLPVRIYNVVRTILQTLRRHQLPINLSTLSPSSLRTLLRPTSTFSIRPGLFTTTFFPYLKHQPSLSLSVLLHSSTSVINPNASTTRRIFQKIVATTFQFFTLPLELTKQECKHNQKELEKIRDDRASVLGEVAQLRVRLAVVATGRPRATISILGTQEYTSLLDTIIQTVQPGSPSSTLIDPPNSSIPSLNVLAQTLPTLDTEHFQLLQRRNLLRPSRLTRIWPRLLLLPALGLYIYTSRTSWVPAIVEMTKDVEDTVIGFVRGWLIEPLLGVLHTVRVGGKGEILVTEEGVLADLESLQRMTLSLAQDALHYTPSQLEVLAQQVKMGDLTPVMQAYEEDIRTPLRSALTGTLLRNAFIQVQKAKVDIDQALSGIDRLLKSQELTFAFVGVAPSLAIVWASLGAAGRLWQGGKGRDRYGGRRKRRGVWERMRRIERLLILQPSNSSEGSDSAPIASLPTGLLILSLTRLRSYALSYLPNHIQAPFLEDLSDLEDTQLDREAKLRVVERMWRCWGQGGGALITYQ